MPLVVLCFWIGIYPKPFLEFLHGPMAARWRHRPARHASTRAGGRPAHGLRDGARRGARRRAGTRRRPPAHADQRAGASCPPAATDRSSLALSPPQRHRPATMSGAYVWPGDGARVVTSWRVKVPLFVCLLPDPRPGLPRLPLLPADLRGGRLAWPCCWRPVQRSPDAPAGRAALARGRPADAAGDRGHPGAGAAATARSSPSRRWRSSTGCARTWSRRRSSASGARRCRSATRWSWPGSASATGGQRHAAASTRALAHRRGGEPPRAGRPRRAGHGRCSTSASS